MDSGGKGWRKSGMDSGGKGWRKSGMDSGGKGWRKSGSSKKKQKGGSGKGSSGNSSMKKSSSKSSQAVVTSPLPTPLSTSEPSEEVVTSRLPTPLSTSEPTVQMIVSAIPTVGPTTDVGTPSSPAPTSRAPVIMPIAGDTPSPTSSPVKAPGPAPTMIVPTGTFQPCDMNDNADCPNEACGLQGGSYVCCPSNGFVVQGGISGPDPQWCTEQPAGSVCFENNVCSGVCVDGVCLDQAQATNASCDMNDNADCQGEACGLQGGSYVCCPSNGFVVQGGISGPDPQWCTEQPAGSVCFENNVCSGVCVDGVCLDQAQATNASCDMNDNADCQGEACGLQGGSYVCCPSNGFVVQGGISGPDPQWCTEQPAGSVCFENNVCSGVCVDGVCLDQAQATNASCDMNDNADCQGEACGLQGGSYVCCPSNGFVVQGGISGPDPQWCTEQPAGSVCFENNVCSGVCVDGVCLDQAQATNASCDMNDNADCQGEACGLQGGSYVCCPSNGFVVQGGISGPDPQWCTEQPAGSVCFENNVCSGVCVDGVCLDQAQATNASCDMNDNADCQGEACGLQGGSYMCCPSNGFVVQGGVSGPDPQWCTEQPAGSVCFENNVCSGVCVDGVCLDQAQATNASCDMNDNADCQGEACGLQGGSYVCCPSNGFVVQGGISGPDPQWCTEQPAGSVCFENNVCSGVCVDGVCLDQAQATNASCDMNDNADCQGEACGLQGGSYVCCPSNGFVVQGGISGPDPQWCTEQPAGSVCFENNVCSGVCVDGVCLDQAQATNASCDMNDNADCQGEACGLQGGSYVCCPSNGFVVQGGVSGPDPQWCTEQPAGSVCFENNVCSGVCVDGVCLDQAQATNASCDMNDNADCQGEACGLQGGSYVCCPSNGFVVQGGISGPDPQWCTEQPAGSVCFENNVCASAVCVGGECLS